MGHRRGNGPPYVGVLLLVRILGERWARYDAEFIRHGGPRLSSLTLRQAVNVVYANVREAAEHTDAHEPKEHRRIAVKDLEATLAMTVDEWRSFADEKRSSTLDMLRAMPDGEIG
jgi:phytoene/squalene synthetase